MPGFPRPQHQHDEFATLKKAGNPFDPTTDARLRTILSAGDMRDSMELYVSFRGRLPSTAALLRSRTLAA